MTALLHPPARPFHGEALAITDELRTRMTNRSWRDDPRCPRFDQLAYLRIDHVTFDGGIARGELVVAAAIAARALELFRRVHALGFPIRQMRLVDDFEASDDASMSADNCSAFNFRLIAGTQLLSQHALGLAIDINPVENPWRRPERLVPAEGAAYADRRMIRPGMFVRPGPVVAMLDEQGWEWGGDWNHAWDDHHLVWSRPL
ncbi:MAG: M15 family metallopeptidase [Deltaproteobacteria bacterium]|nr:M15 family metallopeptidase [Deltaproteobacteria bacterium]